MKNVARRTWLSWASVGVLAVLCGFLALLQNHWIAEVSRAERDRLQQQLQDELNHFAREFNAEIASDCAGLVPSEAEIRSLGREKAYSVRYTQWKQSHDRVFSRIALAVPHDATINLLALDLETGEFSKSDWPAVRDTLAARLNRTRFGFAFREPPDIITLPRFGGPPGRTGPGPEQEWLALELNLDYARASLLPELLHRHLAPGGNRLDYQAVVIDNDDPSKLIYQSAPDQSGWVRAAPDAAVGLFGVNFAAMRRAQARGVPPGPPPGAPRREMLPPPNPPPGPPALLPPGPPAPPGRWRLLVRHQAGSLEAVVARARWQNLATSLGILALILATVAALVRYSRRAQQLADLQMNFVAGVSHELRTPLTVIRTAAFNLRGKLAAGAPQVERYGKLIQEESEKLTALVEQILRFAGARAGHAIRAREPVAIETVIEDGLQSCGAADSKFTVEKQVEPGLPPVLVDQLAMKYVLQNLVENAMKYGTNGSNWIGIFARAAQEANGAAVEVRVADRGPGIPADEQEHIFDPFFRGRRAVEDQVHGTGLGLNLVKNIVEAHGGTIRVESEPAKGAEFVLRIPAAPREPS